MKTSKALQITLDNLWDGIHAYKGSQYICHAAKDSGVGHIVQPIILKLIYPHESFEGWLESKGFGEAGMYKNRQKLQATRKAWLEYLIWYYKERGD